MTLEPTSPLRILLVGPGSMGGRHAAAYARMPDVTLAGVVGTEQDDLSALSQGLGCPTYLRFEDALAAGEFDAVDLCTPTPYHKLQAVQAASAGKHVLCEKPLARTVEEGEAVIRACRDAGVHLLVGHVLRFFPQYAAANATIRSGAIGKPAIARTFRGNGFPQGWRNWYADTEKSGGLLLDLTLHDFDWLYWTFGPVERVYARGLHSQVSEGRDYALVTLRHKSGVLAHVEGTWCHTTPFNMKLEVAGDGGLLHYNDAETRPVTFTPRQKEAGAGPGVAVPESPLDEDPYYLELRHFVDVIQGKAEPRITPEDALEALHIALAAIESVETGKAVLL